MRLVLGLWIICAVSLASSYPQKSFSLSSAKGRGRWADLPSRNETQSQPQRPYHILFDSLSTLTTRWTNTRYRNGHTIAFASIAPGTLLYHATPQRSVESLKGPEWFALDWDHSMVFCREVPWVKNPPPAPGEEELGCHLLTVETTRSLRLVYFDGAGAAKMGDGAMDTQDLVAWGAPDPARIFDEASRINDLCKWAKEHNVDGFVRMVLEYEVMFCGFGEWAKYGVDIIGFQPLPKMWEATPPGQTIDAGFQVFEAGSWHDHQPGDTRVAVDYSRMISLFDSEMFPSLASARAKDGLTRFEYRAGLVTPVERELLMRKLGELSSQESSGSGIDWKTLMLGVRKRYSGRLETLAYILDKYNRNMTEEEKVAVRDQARRHVRSMLLAFILPGVKPKPYPVPGEQRFDWAKQTYTLCASTLTTPFSRKRNLTYSETLLVESVKAVEESICRTLSWIWADGVEIEVEEKEMGIAQDPDETLEVWHWLARSLMNDLDWSDWVKCRPACSFEEYCYLPMWPYFKRKESSQSVSKLNTRLGRGLSTSTSHPEWEYEEEAKRPTPRCVRRMEPFGLD